MSRTPLVDAWRRALALNRRPMQVPGHKMRYAHDAQGWAADLVGDTVRDDVPLQGGVDDNAYSNGYLTQAEALWAAAVGADHPGRVDDRVAALQRTVECGAVAHVADDELCLGGKVGGPPALVDLLDERVEDPDSIAPVEQALRDVTSDETGPAGDQNSFHARNPSIRRQRARQATRDSVL